MPKYRLSKIDMPEILRENDLNAMSMAESNDAAILKVKLDDVQSKEMLDLMVDKFWERWTGAYLSFVYVSAHRDYVFQRLINNGKLTKENLLGELMEPADNSQMSFILNEMLEDEKENERQFTIMYRD